MPFTTAQMDQWARVTCGASYCGYVARKSGAHRRTPTQAAGVNNRLLEVSDMIKTTGSGTRSNPYVRRKLPSRWGLLWLFLLVAAAALLQAPARLHGRWQYLPLYLA